MSLKSFGELDCRKSAAGLRKEISTLSKRFPVSKQERLSDQIVKAARSVTANIAERFGRFHYQGYIRYGRQARGSLYAKEPPITYWNIPDIHEHLISIHSKTVTRSQHLTINY